MCSAIFDGSIFDGSGTNGNFIFDDKVSSFPVKGNVVLAYLHSTEPGEGVIHNTEPLDAIIPGTEPIEAQS